MKLVITLLTAAFLQAGAKGYAQYVTISVKKAAIGQVLDEIQQQTGYDFLYNSAHLKNTKPVDLDFRNAPLLDVLNACFRDQPLTFQIDNKTVLVRRDEAVITRHKPAAQQQRTISGRVTDEQNRPLGGVTVSAKGGTAATSSDAQGTFKLVVDASSRTLVFTLLGFEPQEVSIANVSELLVTLNPGITGLEEVVVVGYGNQRIQDITGSVANIDAENTNIGGASTAVDQLIGGRIAGVQFKQNTAQPGGGGKTIIRGRNSLFLNTDPLYVIDGFIINNAETPEADPNFSSPDRNPLNSINPNDIESIAILKDAAATAIYGAKGSNGVVIITTKRGVQGKAKVQYDGYTSIQQVTNKFDVMDAPEYMGFWNELNQTNFPDDVINNAQTTDWFDQVTQTGRIQSHNLSVSGANNSVNYFVSAGYYDQNGVLRNSGLERLNGRGNIQYKTDRLTINSNIFATRLTDLNQQSLGGTRSSVISAAIAFAPYLPVYNDDGTYNNDPNNSFIANPVSLLDIRDNVYSDKLNYSASTSYEVLPGLRPEVRFTYDVQGMTRKFFVPTTTAYNGNLAHGGTASQTSQRSYSYLVNGLLNYEGTVAESHRISALLGYEYFYRDNSMFQAWNSGFGTDAVGGDNLGSGNAPLVSSDRFDRTDISAFGRVDYSYDDRYLATLTLRRDGSSVFGPNNKFGWFPGISFGWRLDNESFLENSPQLDILKLRIGYGITGNPGIEPYQSLAKYDLGTNGMLGQGAVVGATLTDYRENPDLKWETTAQLNVGLDFGFWSKVSGNLDFFLKSTKDMLIRVQQNPMSGYLYQWQNAASMRTTGLEFSLNTTNVQAGDFQWNTSFNATWLNNEITDYNTTNESTIAALNSIGVIKGERTNSYYTHLVSGIDPNTSSFAFSDLNGDGSVDIHDRAIVGNPDPKITLGLGNTLQYKGVSIDFFFNGAFGNQLHNQTRAQYTVPGGADVSNYLVDAMNYWRPDNSASLIPANRANGGGSWIYNSLWIENAWFVRLQNVNLGYTFPTSFFKNAFSNARIYIQGQNLFVITDYSGIDPEAANTMYMEASENMPAFLPGSTDINAYPFARTFSLGLSLTF